MAIDLSERIISLALETNAQNNTDNEHLQAVQAQIAFAIEIYRGLVQLSAAGNGLASEALLRTLFEVVTSVNILAKHPDKLKDFIRHGRFEELRKIRSIESAKLKAWLAKTVAETEQEFQELFADFKEQRWHRMGTKESFIEAGFQPGMYDQYYRRASGIAHGQPAETVRKGKVQARPIAWKNYAFTAPNMASLLMCMLIAVVNGEFKLGLEKKVADMQKEVDFRVALHMKAISKAVG